MFHMFALKMENREQKMTRNEGRNLLCYVMPVKEER